MNKIAILTDSSADIDAVKASELGIHVVRMPVIVDHVEYMEEEQIKIEQLLSEMKNNKTVSTSQPIPGHLIRSFDTLLKEYDHIIFVPISHKLSGTYQTALSVASEYEGKITVIDAKHVCYFLTDLCLQIKEFVKQGLTPLQIKELVEQEGQMNAWIIPGDLKYLKRGGRISAAAAALASLLKIFPILKFEDGAIDVFDKVRTLKKAHQTAFNELLNVENYDDYNFYVIEAEMEEEAAIYAKEIEAKIGRPVFINKIRAVVLAHVGPGTLAFGRVKKINGNRN